MKGSGRSTVADFGASLLRHGPGDAAAEISPSTFFRHFPTKEDVVITDEYDPIMSEPVRAQPAADLPELIDHILEFLGAGCPL